MVNHALAQSRMDKCHNLVVKIADPFVSVSSTTITVDLSDTGITEVIAAIACDDSAAAASGVLNMVRADISLSSGDIVINTQITPAANDRFIIWFLK